MMREPRTIVAQRFIATYYTIAIATNMQEIKRKGKYKFPIYLNHSLEEMDIENLELSVRAVNCLRRAGYHTIGNLVNAIESDEDLKKIRNCGKTSISEIMNSLLCFQYEMLGPERRKKYINRINELNKGSFLDTKYEKTYMQPETNE